MAGANEAGYHLKNVNLGRDYQATIVARHRRSGRRMPCPICGTPLRAERAIEIGNIFKLGTRYSDALGAMFLDAEGQSHPIVMGSYGIGCGRAAATIAEQRHDEKGLIWPVTVAPYHVSLLSLAPRRRRTTAAAESSTQELTDCRDRGALRRPAGPCRASSSTTPT